MFYTVVIKEY